MDPFVIWEVARFKQYIETDVAHAVMLFAKGNITTENARPLIDGLLRIRSGGPDSLELEGTSLMFMVQTALTKIIGEEAAGGFHVGRSRIDQTATVGRLSARPKYLDAFEAVIALQEALLVAAIKHDGVLMPYLTHMQHAQPGSYSHFMLAYVMRLQDHVEQLRATFAEVNRSPLGTAGRSGTSWNIDRDYVAELLGFDGILYHSLTGRDPHWQISTATAMARVMQELYDLATDLHLWLSSDVNYASIDRGHCSISSIFPHKVNPLTTDKVRNATGEAASWGTIATTICRGMGTGDHQVRQVPKVEEWITTTKEMVLLAALIVKDTLPNKEHLLDIVNTTWVTTTDLVDYLTRETKFRLDYNTAHQVVVRLVKNCKAERLERKDVTPKIVVKAAKDVTGRDIEITAEDLNAALDAKGFVDNCVSAGSVGPNEVEKMKVMAKDFIDANRDWVKGKKDSIAAAANKLNKAASEAIYGVGRCRNV
ncbi:L-Aspartase-like protein [Mycena galericulata]|nr:L-Aspartase-like protein [Mycena galericulata]